MKTKLTFEQFCKNITKLGCTDIDCDDCPLADIDCNDFVCKLPQSRF